MIVLDCTGINFYYQKAHRLRDISFSAKGGELVGLFGENGAGKTTLLKILGGSLRVAHGDVRLFGKVALDSSGYIRSGLRHHLGVLFQGLSSDPKLSAYFNLSYTGQLMGVPSSILDDMVWETLKRAHLSDRAHELVKKFSQGMQRRLEVYRTFMHRPKIVLLDEPTASLDVAESARFFLFLKAFLAETKALVIMATHRSDEIMQCDRVLLMKGGSIFLDRPPQSLVKCLSYVQCFLSLKTGFSQTSLPPALYDISHDAVTQSIEARLPLSELSQFLKSPFLCDENIKAFSIKRPSIADAYKDLL